MKNIKIALFGKARSGKDTVGKILTGEKGFHRYAFGDEIGNIIRHYFPEVREHGKPRKYYQKIGQDFRELNPDVWINCLLRKVDVSLKLNAGVNQHLRGQGKKEIPFNIVVTDGRQTNEADILRKNGFVIVKINCPEEIRLQRMKAMGDVFNPQDLYHDTELQVDKIEADYEIDNFGDLAETRKQLEAILQEIQNK
ncbi:hypothetical protein SCB17_003103 [Clostridium perfringens]|nr:hypothetical protein [Clostridium perfringens]